MAAPNKTENLSATNDHWNKLNASTHTQRLKKLRSSQNYDEKTWQLENQLRNVNSRPELAVEAFRDDCQFSSSGKIKTTIFLQRMRKSRQTDDMKRLNCTQNHHLFRLRLFMDYSTDHSLSIQHQIAIAMAIAIVTKINGRKITLKTLVFL